MKTQFKFLLGIVFLNLSMGMIIALSLPGTEYVQAQSPSNASEYEEHFNATEIAEGWQATPYSGVPIIGDIFSGFQFFFQNIHYLLDGFPSFLYWVSDTYITDASGKTAFNVISNVLRAIYGILMSMFFIEYITGRYVTD